MVRSEGSIHPCLLLHATLCHYVVGYRSMAVHEDKKMTDITFQLATSPTTSLTI